METKTTSKTQTNFTMTVASAVIIFIIFVILHPYITDQSDTSSIDKPAFSTPKSQTLISTHPTTPSPTDFPNRIYPSPNLDRDFFVNKQFVSTWMSGEQGIFLKDGTLKLVWGLDYSGPDDTRPNKGIGKWSFENGTLTISDSSISDGDYSNFRLYEFNGETIVLNGISDGFLIGKNQQIMYQFLTSYICAPPNCSAGEPMEF